MSISADAAPRCQHIKDDGVRCKAPALQTFDFCFWHQRARAPKAKPEIPLLDNENAIQIVLTQTLRQLQDGAIETRRATAMFYGLALAMQNVHKLRCDSSSHITSTLTPAMLEDCVRAEWKSGPRTDPSHEAWKIDPTTDSSHQAWKSGASAPRCDADKVGASAPDVCHGEGERQSDPNHPDAAPTTPTADAFLKRKPPTNSPDHQISSSPDPAMPPDVSRWVKKVLRAGPSHPKFAEVSRIYDRYISTRQTG